jgi:hypothetical protein
MNLKYIQLGTIAVACAFSSLTFAQEVMEMKPSETQIRQSPDIFQEITGKTAAATGAKSLPTTTFGQKPAATPTTSTVGATDTTKTDAGSCDPAKLTDDIYNKISTDSGTSAEDISRSDVRKVIDGGYIQNGGAGCGKEVTELAGPQLANLIRISLKAGECMGWQNPVGNAKRDSCYDQAHQDILGFDTLAAARDNRILMDQNCALNR